MNQLKFFTWHMGKHVSPKDASNISSLLEQKVKKEDGKVMIGKYSTEVVFKTYRIEYNNKLSGFEIEGNDVEVLKTLLFLIDVLPEYAEVGINRNPHEPDEELYFPHKNITMQELIEGLEIEDRWGYSPNVD